MREVVSPSEEVQLPARHPADRDNREEIAPSSRVTETTPSNPVTPNTGSVAKKTWIDRLSWKGVSPITLFRIILIFLFLGGTGVAWAITVKHVGADTGSDLFGEQDDQQQGQDQDNGTIHITPKFSSLVFVHVSFTVVVLFQLLFLERAFFHARAERYLFNHGMPRRAAAMASMGLAPWNRPPLPTYAAALAESGVGTGDVEDNLIAIPPPPAYGNTRGSVLLLSGFLRSSLIRSTSRSSQNSTSTTSPSTTNHRSPEAEMEEGRKSRPISYDASEEVDNAKRARELENALARLESRRG
jgi:hypothetical protein